MKFASLPRLLLPCFQVCSVLLGLEMKGLVQQIPGKVFRRRR